MGRLKLFTRRKAELRSYSDHVSVGQVVTKANAQQQSRWFRSPAYLAISKARIRVDGPLDA